MIPDVSIPTLVLIALGLACLIIAVRSFVMPQSFFKKQEKKEELRKILEKNKTDADKRNPE
jgi:hypothetical protein